MHAYTQLMGSLLVLVPFLLTQFKVMKPTNRRFLLLNLAGSAILAVDAALGEQWGFLLLEAVWAAVSGLGLARSVGGRRHGTADSDN